MFSHLHVHSDYSFLDGFAKVEELVEQAVLLGQPALALTEHGNMCGTVPFVKIARKNGIKPIIGQEFYLQDDRFIESEKGNTRHIVLHAMNETGYKNLVKLSTLANVENFYYRPRITFDWLRQYSDGLICLTACLGGVLARSMHDVELFGTLVDELKYIFGDRLYLEVQSNGLPEQTDYNNFLLGYSEESGIKTVMTTDVHYADKDDYEFHDAWLCIKSDKQISDKNRMRYEPNAYYMISEDEIPKYLLPSAHRTQEIVDRCNFELEMGSGSERFPRSGVENPTKEIRLKSLEKLNSYAIFMEGDFATYRDRLEHEIKVIDKIGYSDYFVIIEDIVSHAIDRGIPVGPGRGSAAGSLTCFLLGITQLDPIKYDLLFERFLHEDRVSPPDIDLDFCKDRRDEVINYVKEKYGSNNVASIGNYSYLQPKQALKDAMRILGIDYSIANTISKMIPAHAKTIKHAVEESPELRNKAASSELIKEALKIASHFQGHIRHTGTHAAGVVVSPVPLDEIVPLQRIKDNLCTQYDMRAIEDLGMLKIDFLGLRTLTVIDNALTAINEAGEYSGTPAWDLELEDKEVYDMLKRGETKGCFMLETPLLTRACLDFSVDRFKDIILIGAICRPVTLSTGMYDQCLQNRIYPDNISYIHNSLKDILDDTHGVAVYQEQIMQMCQKIAGFSMAQADRVRKLISKAAQMSDTQIGNMLVDSKREFYDGAEKNNIRLEPTHRMWDLIRGASYGFNKSHATSYAMLSFMTAWLRCYFPEYLFAAVLSSVAKDKARVAAYIRECKKLGIKVLPPDILRSKPEFCVERGAIRFGLSAVKGIGEDKAIKLREEMKGTEGLTTLEEIAAVCPSLGQKRTLDALTEAGCLDSYINNRRSVLEASKDIAAKIRKYHKANERVDNQEQMFQDLERKLILNIKEREPMTQKEIMELEFERTGMFLSIDPLSKYRQIFLRDCISSKRELDFAIEEGSAKLGGVVVDVSKFLTKKLVPMAKVCLETVFGTVDLVFFPNEWEEFGEEVGIGVPMIISGGVLNEGKEWAVRYAKELILEECI